MELYLTGVVVAAVLGLVELLTIFSDMFSTRFRNFYKVGLFFDPITEKFNANKPSSSSWAFLVANLLLLSPLFSWLSIGFSTITFIKKCVNNAQMQDELKEIEYKLSTIDLQKDIAIELINKLNEVYYGLKDSDLSSKALGKN